LRIFKGKIVRHVM